MFTMLSSNSTHVRLIFIFMNVNILTYSINGQFNKSCFEVKFV